MPLRSTTVRIVVGMFLLVTAGLKLYGLGTTGVPRVGWFAQPWVQLLTAEWELVLGAWLLSGVHPRASWLAVLVTFLAFASVSGYLGWVGVASCNCFGAIKANPWWVLGADAVAVALLAVSRPEAGDAPQFLRTAGVWTGTVALTCAALVGAGSLLFGSVEATFAKLRGDTLVVTRYVDFGTGRSGDMIEAVATVTNWTGEPVRLIGGTSDCTCIAIEDFPLTMQPGEKVSFRLRLKIISEGSGYLTRTVTVRTDCPTRQVIQFRIGCKIAE